MLYSEHPLPTLAEIEDRLSATRKSNLPPLRLAVLRNVTVESIEPYLEFMASELGFRAEVTFGGFDNFAQEALGGAPELLHRNLDAALVFSPLPALSASLDTGFAALSPAQVEEEVARLVELFAAAARGIRAQTNAMILWHGLESPLYPALGIQDAQLPLGQAAVVTKLNEGLRQALSQVDNAYLVSMQSCLARIGARQFYDVRYWHLARSPYSRQGLAEIAREDFKYLRALKGRARKCLVLDCDNTLWGGIVGEDGLEGIKLGGSHPGSAFLEFQREVLSLHRRGVILAVCSKNNEADVAEVFDRHPDMILRREHIAAWRVNWRDKGSNLREIATELNIGIESLVFVDDSEFEINLVRTVAPEVQVLQLPHARPSDYRWILAACGAFDLPHLTEEDRNRGALYQAETTRHRELAQSTDLESYCRSLEIKLLIGRADAMSIPRIAQQTQKTNQFNLTTRRYSDADIRSFAEDDDHEVLWLRVSDKFGDMGIVGSCVMRYAGDRAIIDTLLLSCRALGRGIESRFLEESMHLARRHGARHILGQYIPTGKNGQVAEFYACQGFSPVPAEDGQGDWFSLDLKKAPARERGRFVEVSSPLDA
jgi:FkbH-like protein